MKCSGTLIWHDVEPTDTDPPSCIVVCSGCGEIFCHGNPFDRDHVGLDLIRGA